MRIGLIYNEDSMTTFQQLPGELDIEVGLGDDLSLLLDFDIALTGYTFTGAIQNRSGGEDTDFTIVETNLASGQITISLTDTEISTLGVGVHQYYLTWEVDSLSRRVLAGTFTVKDYL
jgi:hypothetical protein